MLPVKGVGERLEGEPHERFDGGRRNRANAKKLCINVGQRPDLNA
jgi:hypothetical protein